MRRENEDVAGRLLGFLLGAPLHGCKGRRGRRSSSLLGMRLRQPMWSTALTAGQYSSARPRTSGADMSPTSARRPTA